MTPHDLSTRRLTDGSTRTSFSASTQGHQSVQSIQPPRGIVARWGRGVQTTHLFKVLFKHLSSKTFSDSSIRASFQRLDVVFPGNVGGRGYRQSQCSHNVCSHDAAGYTLVSAIHRCKCTLRHLSSDCQKKQIHSSVTWKETTC